MIARLCPHVSKEVEGAARRLTSFLARDGFRLSAIHQYCHPDGQPWWWMVRLQGTGSDHISGKVPKRVFPMRRTDVGFELRRPETGSVGLPLYNLHLLGNYPATWKWIVEGEKAADWLSFTLDPAVVCTWAGGAGSVDRCDWSPLAGQCVVLWPDFDRGGFEAVRRIQDILRGMGCFVLVLDVASLGLPPKGDAVDFLVRYRHQKTGLVDHGVARARLANVDFCRVAPEWKVAA